MTLCCYSEIWTVSTSIDKCLATMLDSFGMEQLVDLPTRDKNLLDVLATYAPGAINRCTCWRHGLYFRSSAHLHGNIHRVASSKGCWVDLPEHKEDRPAAMFENALVSRQFLHRLPLQPTLSQTTDCDCDFGWTGQGSHQSRNAFGISLSQSPSGCHRKQSRLRENVADGRSSGRRPRHLLLMLSPRTNRSTTNAATSSTDGSLAVQTPVSNGRLQRSCCTCQIQSRQEPTSRINHSVTHFLHFFIAKYIHSSKPFRISSLPSPLIQFPCLTNQHWLASHINANYQGWSSHLIGASSSKSSSMHFILTSFIKSCSSIFAEIITTLAILSVSQGTFPSSF